eukprot:9344606-Pyramimonas_sp.AAC.1
MDGHGTTRSGTSSSAPSAASASAARSRGQEADPCRLHVFGLSYNMVWAVPIAHGGIMKAPLGDDANKIITITCKVSMTYSPFFPGRDEPITYIQDLVDA